MTTIVFRPDICKCVITVNEKFQMQDVISKCKMHTALENNACFNTIIDKLKEINYMEWKEGETKEDHENRIWFAKEKALKGN